ncbi:hypothetical protein SUGI_1139950 [Cryptomeria japonica]|nr:hypothetical protein SUGI_1139950 [Cryptomeria japonica]
MGNKSDDSRKFMIVFMVLLIVGGTIMVEAIGITCNCKTDDDCGGAGACCFPGTCGDQGFCCDPNPFVPPDELTN